LYKRHTIHLIRIQTRIVDGLETVFGKLGKGEKLWQKLHLQVQ